MFLDPFHSVIDGSIRIAADQASRFAKDVAGDYNPIHDADSRRFCVPGDLLCALVLSRYGLSAHMTFTFRGMVGDRVPLRFPEANDAPAFDVTDESGRVYLHVERDGPCTTDLECIEAFTRRYVAFSGQNFPHVLRPLMARHGVMFNPDRPLVIYDSMEFRLDTVEITEPDLQLTDATLEVTGRRGDRGDVLLHFGVTDAGATIGGGAKNLVISGLRAYDEARLDAFIEDFTRRKAAYLASREGDSNRRFTDRS